MLYGLKFANDLNDFLFNFWYVNILQRDTIEGGNKMRACSPTSFISQSIQI